MAQSFRCERIEHKVAKPFIVAHHYSKNCPTGLNVFFGAFLDDGTLYAVADYGMGANMDKGASLARLTGCPVRFQTITPEWLDAPHKHMDLSGLKAGPLNCLELKRLCRLGEDGDRLENVRAHQRGADGSEKTASLIPLTQFLSRCHKLLRQGIALDKKHPETVTRIKYIVSYSDPAKVKAIPVEPWDDLPLRYPSRNGRWHVPPPIPIPHPITGVLRQEAGHIYRAANFKYLGMTDPQMHVVDNKTGEVLHRRKAFRYKQRHGGTIDEARKKLDYDPILTPPKERWFLAL